jgi:hypothetical protein
MQTTLGVSGAAAIGALAVPKLASLVAAKEPTAAKASTDAQTGQIVLRVLNVSTSRVEALVGERSVIFSDPVLVAHILKAVG